MLKCANCWRTVLSTKNHWCGSIPITATIANKLLETLAQSDINPTVNQTKRILFPNNYRDKIANEQDGWCMYCGEPLDLSFHIDHVMPISKGGSNQRENLVASCPNCNQVKHAKYPSDFLKETNVSRD